MAKHVTGTFSCPACGANVREGALACPECGSDEETGWSEEAEYAHLELPTGYAEEEPTPTPTKRPWSPAWVVIAVIVMVLLLVLLGAW
ncbi:MAG: zinc ribbon domain-containing protein [Planctomycetota bacterium]